MAEEPLREVESLERYLEYLEQHGERNEGDQKQTMQRLKRAKEAAKDIPLDVMRRSEERAQRYEAHHPFFN